MAADAVKIPRPVSAATWTVKPDRCIAIKSLFGIVPILENNAGMPMEGCIIKSVLEIGTSERDDLGYVECELPDGSRRLLAFPVEKGSEISTAFMSAYAHLQMKRAVQAGKHAAHFDPFPVSAFNVTFGQDASGKPAGMIDVETPQGAKLHLAAPKEAVRSLIEQLEWLLERMDNPRPANS